MVDYSPIISEPPNIVGLLRERELGRRRKITELELPNGVERRADGVYNEIVSATEQLRLAVDTGLWSEVEYAVGNFISKILDNSNPDQVFNITPTKRQERELFVSLGGVHLLLRLFAKPFSEPDARSISPTNISRRAEVWNEVLVILREVAFAVPTLSEQVFGNDHIIFLFTLMSHSTVFENTMNLLEEILAVRVDTFSLALVPDLYGLLSKFSIRQLAHFCRVLSLVLFEPEDRQIMEGSQVLKSCELLQLRRDRMAKASNVVERNQCLIIEMPNMLSRLVLMLRIVNYGPTLADMIRHNIVVQGGLTSDLFQLLGASSGVSEWEHFSYLDTLVRNAEIDGQQGSQTTTTGPAAASAASPFARNTSAGSEGSGSTNNNSSNSGIAGASAARVPRSPTAGGTVNIGISEEADPTMAELLSAFSSNPSAGAGGIDMNSLLNVIQVAQSLGIATMGANNGDADEDSWLMAALQMHVAMTGDNTSTNLLEHNRRGGRRSRTTIPADAKKELQFHSMLLAPHQVELLFVFCTLLSGRRKIDVQHRLGALGLADVLLRMFNRLSWDSPPFVGPNPLEHIHGPGCECNPESALRVQYLRLVHNFYDRDFLGNPNKKLVLTPAESMFIAKCSYPEQASREGLFLTGKDRGLISQIITTLLKEPTDSIYRFWLSSCLEAFLRGSGPEEQLFVALSGALNHTVSHIVDMGVRPSVNLQTSFDLLGEMLKTNEYTVGMLETALTDNRFRVFMEIVMSNLVDSNVFLRSLYLSMEVFADRFAHRQRRLTNRRSIDAMEMTAESLQTYEKTNGGGHKAAEDSDYVSYLTHTWIQFSPKPRSEKAIELVRQHQAKLPAYTNTSNAPAPRHRTGARRLRGDAAPASQGMRYFNLSLVLGSGNSNNSNGETAAAGGSTGSGTLTNSISSIGNNVRGAIRNIREVASHFLLGGGSAAAGSSPRTDALTEGAPTPTSPPRSRSPLVTDSGHGSDRSNSNHSNSRGHGHNTTSTSTAGGASTSTDSAHAGGAANTVSIAGGFSFNFFGSAQQSPQPSKQKPSPLLAETAATSPAKDSSSVATVSALSKSGATTPDFDDFMTPPEMPYYSTRKSGKGSTAGSRSMSREKLSDLAAMPNKETAGGSDRSSPSHGHGHGQQSQGQSQAAGWTVPDSMFRLYMFLVQEREYVLLKLMSTVTIHTINHENICCLNTALLILVLADKRGQLAHTLRQLRRVAEDVIAHGAFISNLDSAIDRLADGHEAASASSDAIPSLASPSSSVTAARTTSSNVEADDVDVDGNSEEEMDTSKEEGADGDVDAADSMLCSVCASLAGAMTISDPISSDSTDASAASSAAPVAVSTGSRSDCLNCPKCSVLGGGRTRSPKRLRQQMVGRGASTPTPNKRPPTGISLQEKEGVQEGIKGNSILDDTVTTASEDIATSTLSDKDSKANRVLANFRELLWYWQEYYLRRGRDRLSIEFSSHIPFQIWSDLVDKLCRDDGAPTSLLSSPIALPRSPYSRLSRVHNSSSTEFIHFVV